MSIISKAKVISIENGKAIVEREGKKQTVSIRDDIKLKKGDKVMISLGVIVDKIKK